MEIVQSALSAGRMKTPDVDFTGGLCHTVSAISESDSDGSPENADHLR